MYKECVNGISEALCRLFPPIVLSLNDDQTVILQGYGMGKRGGLTIVYSRHIDASTNQFVKERSIVGSTR